MTNEADYRLSGEQATHHGPATDVSGKGAEEDGGLALEPLGPLRPARLFLHGSYYTIVCIIECTQLERD